jgi:hypothetical protein
MTASRRRSNPISMFSVFFLSEVNLIKNTSSGFEHIPVEKQPADFTKHFFAAGYFLRFVVLTRL